MTRNTFIQLKLHHLLIWILVWITWYFLRFQDYAPHQAVIVTTIKTLDLALMIYLANYILVPKLLYEKKYLVFVLAYILMILVSSISKMFAIAAYLQLDMNGMNVGLKERFYNNVVPHFFIVTAGVAVKLVVDFLKMKARIAELAKERAESELNFLKSQINPHFLFNSLNAVYFLINRDNIEARQALHKFSDMLRFQLYEVKGESIPVEKEISYLRDYIDLQKLRRNDNFKIELNVEPGISNFQIEPLILLTFVENSFKHLSNFGEQEQVNQIKIDISRQNGTLNFSVQNTMDEHSLSNQQPGGIGLANVKRRLELLYPGKHGLQMEKHSGRFLVNLQLKIENACKPSPVS